MKWPEIRLRQDATYATKYDAMAWYLEVPDSYNVNRSPYTTSLELYGMLTLEEAKEMVAQMQAQIELFEKGRG